MSETVTTIFDNGETGDKHFRLEQDADGLLYETSNAATRQLVCAEMFVGWDLLSPEWERELTEQFDSKEIAKRYIRAARDEDK